MTPGETISARLQRLESYLQLLEGFRTEPRSALLGDPVRRGALERYLQLAIEACSTSETICSPDEDWNVQKPMPTSSGCFVRRTS